MEDMLTLEINLQLLEGTLAVYSVVGIFLYFLSAIKKIQYTQFITRNNFLALRCLIWVSERNKCSLCSCSLLPMDKLWDLDVEIQLAASQIDHGLEIFIISEPSGATLDVLYNAVHPFQNGIRIGVLEIVQDFVPMIADRATKLLHGFQSCVHHPAAELFQMPLRLVSMDGLLVDFLQFDAHGTGTRCL